MRKPLKSQSWLSLFILISSLWSEIVFSAAPQDQLPRLILWNLAKKSGQVLVMESGKVANVYVLTVPVLQGSYTYRVMVGNDREQIYGAHGERGGPPIPLELSENRTVAFSFEATTHQMTLQIGAVFTPEKKVVLAGSLQKALGHTGGQFGGVWDPAAETTRLKSLGNGLFAFTGTLPPGAYEYKIALNGSWQENYGQDGKRDGANIPLKIETESKVTFYYNDHTHKIADSTWYTMLPEDQLPRLVGDLQTAAGAALILRDDAFDQLYTLKMTLPKGAYAYRIAAGAGQTLRYGANAVPDGPPLTFTLPENREVAIFFDGQTQQSFVDDGSLDEQMMQHDTFSLRYRTPLAAVKTGQPMTLKLQARKGDIQKATLRVGKADIAKRKIQYGAADREYALAYLAAQTLAGGGDVDLWGVTLTLNEPGLYGYKFYVNNFKEYGDDDQAGGIGKAAFRGTQYFPLTVYDANFKTPDWLKKAIIYQIFPDRFFNGDHANDAVKAQARGAEPYVLKAWTDLPAAPNLGNDADAFFNNDFFGGDLAGIRQKLDYLQSLGVTALYLNPIFTAPSNHKYDTTDYDQIDPAFGAAADFQALTQEMTRRGMSLILDGVFNHVGDDSIYFDRYGKYAWVGAYEYWARVFDKMNAALLRTEDAKVQVEAELLAAGQKLSPYKWHNWFRINNRHVQGRYDYQGWSDYDSLPAIKEPGPHDVDNPAVAHASELNNRDWANYILYDENSVAKRWLKQGAAGWRLDVADEIDPAFWQAFRQELKRIVLPSGEVPAILGETWQDASSFFLGDQFDSVMNYGFRYAVIERFLLNGDAASADAVFRAMRQNYPPEAFVALMNLIGSHDTPRAIYVLGGGADQALIAEKGKNFDYELGKRRLQLAVIFQMGYPGAPAIYYGDEAGQFGARDPDCRRTYPWGREDQDVLAHYRNVAKIRTARRDLFALGELFTLYAEGDVYVYGRTQGAQAAVIAINRGTTAKELTLDMHGQISDSVTLTDQLDAAYTVTTSADHLQLTIPPLSGRMLVSAAK